jgi:hypothetical protein
VMGAVVEPGVEMPPVVEQGDEVGHEPAGAEGPGGVAAKSPIGF